MAKHKIDIEKFEHLASKLRAMSHPARIEIIDLLYEKPRSVKEIIKLLQIHLATTSHHLSVLKSYGLVSRVTVSQNSVYSVKTDALQKVLELMDGCVEA